MRSWSILLVFALLTTTMARHGNLRMLQRGEQVPLQPDTSTTPPQYVPASDSPQFDVSDRDEWWELKSDYPDPGFIREAYQDAYDVDDASDIQWVVTGSNSVQ